MARFIGRTQGKAGEAARLGERSSGIRSSVNGWGLGVDVSGFVDERDEDCFVARVTAGSSGGVASQDTAVMTTVRGATGIETNFSHSRVRMECRAGYVVLRIDNREDGVVKVLFIDEHGVITEEEHPR